MYTFHFEHRYRNVKLTLELRFKTDIRTGMEKELAACTVLLYRITRDMQNEWSLSQTWFLDLEGGSQNTTLVVQLFLLLSVL